MFPLRRPCLTLVHGVGVSLALAFLSSRSFGQARSTRLTVSASTVTFDPATVDDYAAGFVTGPQGITYTVATENGGRRRLALVSIRATSATVGGGKPVGDVQWRRADQPTWNPLTLIDSDVEAQEMTNTVNTPWSNRIVFRILLSWRAVPPATYTADILITLTQTLQ